MKISPSKKYHAQSAGRTLLRLPDCKSIFKVYFLSIINRDTPELFDWECSPINQEIFLEHLASLKPEGVGFVIAFPHITKLYRFSPEAEIILDVKELNMQNFTPVNLTRGDGWHEFGCYAEAIIAASEYTAWADAASIEKYLDYWCEGYDFPTLKNDKLREWWENV